MVRERREKDISTHAPLAGRDESIGGSLAVQQDFNPRAPCGARRVNGKIANDGLTFQPTRPLRGATAWAFGSAIVPAFQPTRPLRGATPSIEIRLTDSEISTHAPLAGRDSLRSTLAKSDVNFNPRAPCGARRLFCFVSCRLGSYFNPRAPCGARPALLLFVALGIYISTHAPLAGRDMNSPDPLRGHGEFQPTRPLRGATFGAVLHLAWHIIFQPTRPLRGATCDIQPCSGGHPISTHAPLAGRDFFVPNRLVWNH